MKKKTRRPVPWKLRTSRIINLAVSTVKDALALRAGKNVTYPARTILLHLLNACCCLGSIYHVSTTSMHAPSEGAVRHRLRGLGDVEERVNHMLRQHVLKTLPRRPLVYAIDYHQVPYYGEAGSEEDVVRGKARDGTTRFFAYATIYVILRNKRYTLAVKHVRKGDALVDVIDYLLAQVTEAGLEIGRLYLDRGFYTIDVINHLNAMGIAFIIPCIARGKKGGIRRLLKGGRSYSTTYTMRSGEKKASFGVNVVVRYRRGRRKKHGIEYLAFAVHDVEIPVNRTHKEYRKRFGIESSYKLMNTARARTSSRSPVLRLLYVALGFLLLNLWIYHHWLHVSVKRKGGRKLCEWRFKTMLRQVERAIEDTLGFTTDAVVPA